MSEWPPSTGFEGSSVHGGYSPDIVKDKQGYILPNALPSESKRLHQAFHITEKSDMCNQCHTIYIIIPIIHIHTPSCFELPETLLQRAISSHIP